MEKEPNTDERLRQNLNPSNSWSELPLDLLNSVFEHLGFSDFQRGKSVCSSWYTASRQSVPKNQIPWFILPPQDKNNNSWTLFNPEEKDKLYQTQDLGSESVCMTTYGSWLFKQDPLYNLYILNLFTRERIDLPHVMSQLGTIQIERILDGGRFRISNQNVSRGMFKSPVFWVDDKTKDYVVVWGLAGKCVVYAKKGGISWTQIPETSNCFDMVYKDHKLYYLSQFGTFKIFEFSKDVPLQTFQSRVEMNWLQLRPRGAWNVQTIKLVVTVRGDVLKVEKKIKPSSRVWSFVVYKVYSSRFSTRHEQVDSLGDEAMLLNLGITVPANDIEGLKRNSIYFNGCYQKKKSTNELNLFNLETRKFEPLHKFQCSANQFYYAKWFLPSFV